MLRRRETTTEKESFDLSGVPETMLQTLYARAKESRKQPHYIYDAKAIEIVEALDYDFTLADQDALMGSGVLARTIVLDKMVGDFLQAHPGAVIINLACGLDMRCYRTTQNYRRWYNLDLPETIAARAHFLPENGPVYQIAASAMDAAWAGAVQQTKEPVLIIIEGLTMYLTEQDVKQIFAIVQKRFAHATVFAETMTPLMVRHIKEKSIEGGKAKGTLVSVQYAADNFPRIAFQNILTVAFPIVLLAVAALVLKERFSVSTALALKETRAKGRYLY